MVSKKENNENDISNKLDEIYELLKISVANSLLDNIEYTFLNNEKNVVMDEIAIDDEILKLMDLYGLKIVRKDAFSDKVALYFEVKTKISANDMLYVTNYFKKNKKDFIPIFQFSRINGMQRKKLEQEKISYYIENKELHIYT